MHADFIRLQDIEIFRSQFERSLSKDPSNHRHRHRHRLLHRLQGKTDPPGNLVAHRPELGIAQMALQRFGFRNPPVDAVDPAREITTALMIPMIISTDMTSLRVLCPCRCYYLFQVAGAVVVEGVLVNATPVAL